MTSKPLLSLLVIFSFGVFGKLKAQNKDFYGKDVDKSICPIQTENVDNKNATSALNKICNVADIPNNFTLTPCAETGNCYALYKDGVSYIVYDPKFFKRVQTFGFTEKNLPGSVDWVSLTILAHELGHHLSQHTTNTMLTAKFTPSQLELQADEFAGSMMYKLGASLVQAQKAMYTAGVTEKASLSHPARKDRLDAIAKGYNKYANRTPNNSVVTTNVSSDGRITMVVPQFKVIPTNVRYNIAEQMKQILVSNLENNGVYNIVASSFDLQNYRNDPAVAYGGEQAIKKANYILMGKLISYDEKDNSLGLGQYKANLGKTMKFGFSFEVISAKTNQIVLIKNWDMKVRAGTVGISTGVNKLNGNLSLNADIAEAYEKNVKQIIKYIEDQKSKIVLN